jgi:hypothetical protein
LFRSTKNRLPDGKETIETAKKIDISFIDSDNINYQLLIYYQQSGGDIPEPIIRGPGGAFISSPIIFERSKSGAGSPENFKLDVTINQFGQLQQPPSPPFGPATLIFGTDMNYAEIDNVTWFSQLKEINKAEMVISFIRDEFQFIAGIEVLAPRGRQM